MKSSHHLSHDQASKGHVSIPDLASQTDLHCRIKSQYLFKNAQRDALHLNRCKVLFKQKNILGLGAL